MIFFFKFGSLSDRKIYFVPASQGLTERVFSNSGLGKEKHDTENPREKKNYRYSRDGSTQELATMSQKEIGGSLKLTDLEIGRS